MTGLIIYIDDFLAHSKNHEDHLNQLEELFSRPRNDGLKAKLPKCKFGAKNVQYLGYRLTLEDMLLGVDKLKAFKIPKHPNMLRK
jgi:hypothetical protein